MVQLFLLSILVSLSKQSCTQIAFMFPIFLLSIFFSTSSGLQQEVCLKQQFIEKSEEDFPKRGVQCEISRESTEVGNRWRGELIYEELEDKTGINIKWKHIAQNPECPRLIRLFVNNLWIKNIYPQNRHKNVDSIELRERETFELKIQVRYHSEPKCLEASTTIELTKTISPTYDPTDENNNEENSNEETSEGETQVSESGEANITHFLLPPFPTFSTLEEDIETTSENNTGTQNNTTTQDDKTTTQNNTRTQNTRTQDHEATTQNNTTTQGNNTRTKNTTTIIICSVAGSGVLLISIAGIAFCRKKYRSGSNNLKQAEVDENPDYGIYSDDPDDDYITVEDNNDYYASD